MKENSYFDGTVKEHVIHEIKSKLMIILTLGIAYPWILCSSYKTRVEHTVIEGKRLSFHGDPRVLFKAWLKYLILIYITFGVYKIVAGVRLNQWLTEHTTFE